MGSRSPVWRPRERAAVERQRLGAGIYDPPTAARLLLAGRMANEAYPVSSRTLIRWIRSGLATPELAEAPGRALLLNFEDLISLRVVAALRSYGVRWKAIWTAERWLRETTGHSRPFAREEMWTATSDVFVSFRGMITAASKNGQLAMEIVRDFLIPIHGLVFADHVATQWRPIPGIVIDPRVQFGEPCIEGTRIPVRAVYASIEGGDRPEFVREAYNLTTDAMDSALSWGKRAAA
jgi:uncharacterized protein (DUF433 family)